jgi:hypothetical protein
MFLPFPYIPKHVYKLLILNAMSENKKDVLLFIGGVLCAASVVVIWLIMEVIV